jgi:neutral trehalase
VQFGEPIFEIAVYRKSPDALQKEYDDWFEKEIHRLDPHRPISKIDREDQTFKYVQNLFWEKHGTPYPYNQAIGWVVLIAARDQILAEYYKITGKRGGAKLQAISLQMARKMFRDLPRGKRNSEKDSCGNCG